MKTGKNKKHVFLIFRSSITYPKIKMIGGGHLKYSPCSKFFIGRDNISGKWGIVRIVSNVHTFILDNFPNEFSLMIIIRYS